MKSHTTVLYTTKRIAFILSSYANTVEKSKRARYMRTQYSTTRKRVNCTLTFREYQQLVQEAKTLGKSPTAFIREATFAYIENRQLVSSGVETELATLVFLFRNMACNINQIAKHANTYKKLKVVDVLALSRTVQELERLVIEFVEKPISIRDDN